MLLEDLLRRIDMHTAEGHPHVARIHLTPTDEMDLRREQLHQATKGNPELAERFQNDPLYIRTFLQTIDGALVVWDA